MSGLFGGGSSSPAPAARPGGVNQTTQVLSQEQRDAQFRQHIARKSKKFGTIMGGDSYFYNGPEPSLLTSEGKRTLGGG